MDRPLTILVVDDSATSLAVLFDYLDGLGHKVLVAENGESCLWIARQSKPDLILVDIILPGIDGYEVCRQLKHAPATQKIPVFFMSSKDEYQSRVESFKSGGAGFITKPIIYQEIRQILELQSELLELRSNKLSELKQQSLSEFDAIIDFIAHDMRSPLACISGFATEINDELQERPEVEDLMDYIGIILKSSSSVELILEALVLLKNLRLKEWSKPETCNLDEILSSVQSRYGSFEWEKALSLEADLRVAEVMSEQTLLEELILIIFRNLSSLTPEGNELAIHIQSRTEESHTNIVIRANTRDLTSSEIEFLLEPMQGNIRRRVQDANILTICAQKIIQHLTMNAWGSFAEDGLSITLSMPDFTNQDDHD